MAQQNYESTLCEISGDHGGGYEDFCFRDVTPYSLAVYSGFGEVLAPSSGYTSANLKIEAACFSNTVMNFYQ
jgi:hypothetical protein